MLLKVFCFFANHSKVLFFLFSTYPFSKCIDSEMILLFDRKSIYKYCRWLRERRVFVDKIMFFLSRINVSTCCNLLRNNKHMWARYHLKRWSVAKSSIFTRGCQTKKKEHVKKNLYIQNVAFLCCIELESD
jgi:hypothetical protein